MSFTKISLLSLILITSFSHIDAMEEVTQSIQQKLLVLDAAIVKTAQNLKIAEQQRDKDKKTYENYNENYINERNKTWFLSYDHTAPEVCAYNGDFISRHYGYKYLNNGSKGKYDQLCIILKTNQEKYNEFKDEFKRGKRVKNIDYLQDVEQNLQNYLNLEEAAQPKYQEYNYISHPLDQRTKSNL